MIDYFTGSKFSININSNLAILMMPQPQNHNFGSRRLQILEFFLPECRRIKTPYATHIKTRHETWSSISFLKCSNSCTLISGMPISRKIWDFWFWPRILQKLNLLFLDSFWHFFVFFSLKIFVSFSFLEPLEKRQISFVTAVFQYPSKLS